MGRTTTKRSRSKTKKTSAALLTACDVCEQPRAPDELFECGHTGSGRQCCLHCVRDKGTLLQCHQCHGILGYSDGHNEDAVRVGCYHGTNRCSMADDTLGCHVCGIEVCDVVFADRETERRWGECNTVFCLECLAGKGEAHKKKQK